MPVDRDNLKTLSGPLTVAAVEKAAGADDVRVILEVEKERSAPRKTVLDAVERKLEELRNASDSPSPKDIQNELKKDPNEQTPPAAPLKAETKVEEGKDGERKVTTPKDADIKKDAATAAKHNPATDGLRPEVLHQESGPPVEAIRANLEQIAEDSKATQSEEPKKITVREDLLDQILGDKTLDEARAEIDQVLLEEKITLKGNEAALKEIREVENIRHGAELSHNYPDLISDPLAPAPVESSNVDTHAQRDDAARAAAEPLRIEATESMVDRVENAGQHTLAGDFAEAGKPWPVPAEDPEALAERNAKETAETVKWQQDEAQKNLKKLKGESSIVARARADRYATGATPLELAGDDVEMANALRVGYSPASGGFSIGSAVSRLDEAHNEIGVVLEIDMSNPTHQLLKVKFPTEGEHWLAPGNLAYEGEIEELAG